MNSFPEFIDPDMAICDLVLSVPENLKKAELADALQLLQKDGKEVYEFIKTHFAAYKKLPNRDTIYTALGKAVPEGAPEPLEHYLDVIRQRKITITLATGIKAAGKNLANSGPERSIEKMRETLSLIDKVSSKKRTADIDYADNAGVRLERYSRVADMEGGVVGIPFPWPTLNQFTGGIEDGDLVTLVAASGKGKSWLLCNMVAEAMLTGKRCLLASMEMDPIQLALRIDSLLLHMSHDAIRRGLLSDMGERDKYEEFLRTVKDTYKDSLKILATHSAKTVQELSFHASEFAPDIVYVDGAYIMKGTNRNSSKHEQLLQIVEDLKFLGSEHGVPVVETIQFNRDVLKGKSQENLKGDIGDVGGSYGFVQFSDSMLGIFQNEEMEKQGRMLIRLLKNRHSQKGTDITLISDFQRMEFKEVGGNQPIPAVNIGGESELYHF